MSENVTARKAQRLPQWREAWGLRHDDGWYGTTIDGFDGVLVFAGYLGACCAAAEIKKSQGVSLWPERLCQPSVPCSPRSHA